MMDAIKRYWPWIFIILPALAFAAAGGAKLAGVPAVHASFEMMGLPSWFGYFIGGSELAGAIGLVFMPGLRKIAAAGLSIIMLGAIYFHIAYSAPSFIPAAILLVCMIFVVSRDWTKTQPA